MLLLRAEHIQRFEEEVRHFCGRFFQLAEW